MRITRVDAIPIVLPLAKPLLMGGRKYESSESLLVHVQCCDSVEGWGEAAPYLGHGEQLAALAAEVERVIAPLLRGEPLSRRAALIAQLAHDGRCSPRAISAVEIALADAQGHASGLSVADLYGGARRCLLTQKWLIGGASVEADIAETRRRIAEGLSVFMLKVGSKSLADDVLLARRLREEFGESIELCADANGAWTRAQAGSYLAQVSGLGLVYLEQPLPAGALREAAAVAAESSTPLSVDEGVASAADILAAWQAKAIRGAIIKPSKYGGLARALEAGMLCAALGLNVGLATPMAETSIGTAAALQVAATLPQVAWGIGPSSDYLAEDVAEAPIRHEAGQLRISSGPGLGLSVSRRQVERFRVDR